MFYALDIKAHKTVNDSNHMFSGSSIYLDRASYTRAKCSNIVNTQHHTRPSHQRY